MMWREWEVKRWQERRNWRGKEAKKTKVVLGQLREERGREWRIRTKDIDNGGLLEKEIMGENRKKNRKKRRKKKRKKWN